MREIKQDGYEYHVRAIPIHPIIDQDARVVEHFSIKKKKKMKNLKKKRKRFLKQRRKNRLTDKKKATIKQIKVIKKNIEESLVSQGYYKASLFANRFNYIAFRFISMFYNNTYSDKETRVELVGERNLLSITIRLNMNKSEPTHWIIPPPPPRVGGYQPTGTLDTSKPPK